MHGFAGRRAVIVVAGTLLALVFAAPALAQDTNAAREIIPADGTELEVAPTEIVISFDQEIRNDDIPRVDLACGGQPQAVGLPAIGGDDLVVTTAINAPLPATTCLIAYSLTNGSGDILVVGSSSFRVLNATTTTSPSGDQTSTTLDPFFREPAVPATTGTLDAEPQGGTGGAIWLGRLLSTLGVLAIFGGLVVIALGWPEGPEYVITARYFLVVWVVAVLGALLYVVALAAEVGGTGLGAAVSPAAWVDLVDDGWAGRGALLRLVGLAACWYVVIRPDRVFDEVTAMWGWAIPIGAVAAAAMTRVDGPLAVLGYLVNVVHLLSVGVWFGGAMLVSRVVLAGPGDSDLVRATKTFSKLSPPAILVASATGLIQMWRLDGGNLFGSNHGRVLLLKAVVVAAMVAVSFGARQQVAVRLGRATEMTAPLADRFKRAFGTEMMVGVVVLAFSGWLLTLTPPKADPLGNESYLDAMVFQHAPSGLDAVVRVGPGFAGPTGLRVDVRAPEAGISSLLLRFIPPEGSGAATVEQPIPATGAGTYYLDDSMGVPLLAVGVWTLELSASTTTGILESARYTFELAGRDGVDVSTTTPGPVSEVSVAIVEQVTTTAPFVGTPVSVAPGPIGTSPPTSAP
ncbi:MAG: CopD family protein [Ilumatobacteraceae bacterium]